MWIVLLEAAAGIFGTTRRAGWLSLHVALVSALALGAALAAAVGPAGLIPAALLAGVGAGTTFSVLAARERVYRAACLPLDDPRQRPRRIELGSTPVAVALRGLAGAIDAVRRGHYDDASDLVMHVRRDLLRPDEERLLDAVRGMISLSLDDRGRAARQAALALPTGIEELDALLGRAVVTHAWQSPARLRALCDAWDRADAEGTFRRLRKLVRLRLDTRGIDAVGAADARALEEEARAVGDADLAADLALRALRRRAYR